MVPQEANVFAEEWPDTGEIGDVDGYGGFADVPEHVDCAVDVAQVVDFCKNRCDDLCVWQELSVGEIKGVGRWEDKGETHDKSSHAEYNS